MRPRAKAVDYFEALAPSYGRRYGAGGGVWHREGWTGSVLTASALVSPAADQQAEQVSEFVDSALAAARELLA